MKKYMLLLHDNTAGFADVSPEQMQQVIQKYMAWGERLRTAGIITDGQKLTDEPGKVVRKQNGQVKAIDGPYSEPKEVLGGYYTINAESYDQAIQRASDCPHLEYGGTIEVREIDAM